MEKVQFYKIDKDKVVYRIIAGEAVMLNLDNGYYYSLDEIGTKVWTAIDEKKNISEIIGDLEEEYEVSASRLKTDIMKLIEHLGKARLITKS